MPTVEGDRRGTAHCFQPLRPVLNAPTRFALPRAKMKDRAAIGEGVADMPGRQPQVLRHHHGPVVNRCSGENPGYNKKGIEKGPTLVHRWDCGRPTKVSQGLLCGSHRIADARTI